MIKQVDNDEDALSVIQEGKRGGTTLQHKRLMLRASVERLAKKSKE